MTTVKQFRFFGYKNEDNYPKTVTIEKDNKTETISAVTYNSLVSGDLFFEYQKLNSAKQLGIQTMPGTKFYLGPKDQDYGIIIGKTGIYELNTEKLGISIDHLSFDGESIEAINRNPNAYLIVDIIYS